MAVRKWQRSSVMRFTELTGLRIRHLAAVLTVATVLAGCVNEGMTTPDRSRFSPTAQEQAELIAYGQAGMISKRCQANPRLLVSNAEFEKTLGKTIERAKAAGVRVQYEAAVLLGVTKEEAMLIGATYMAERGIVPEQSETWCAAGRYEMRNKTRIGKYLYEYTY